ncbi:urease accessory protein UreD [Cohnella hongkongensis]|uniref:Urease accessory protein UreD n=1 Tax=Cohnella hongkongensis TaxID=178337 RepID=A0ABV9FCA3_9BACL
MRPWSSEIARTSELRAVAGLSGGRPALLSRYHSSPLKIAKAFPVRCGDGRQLAVVQMDGSPGMLEGDRYLFDWTLRDGVRLYATNQSYTRVHPCEKGNAKLAQKFDLQAGAVLEWMPEPVMLFRDARFRSETEIDLAEDAVCMMTDIFCPGRLSRGEAFAFGSYDARLTVRFKGELIHYQRQLWEPASLPVENSGCFGAHTHVGSFMAFSDRLTRAHADRIREAIGGAGEALPGGVVWGVARLDGPGLAVQAAGNAAWKLQKLLLIAWDIVRRELLGLPPLRLIREAWMHDVE